MLVKIIFVGLFALAPVSDEEILILAVRAMDHEARIEQTAGTCRQGCEGAGQLNWTPDEVDVRLELDDRVPLELARTSLPVVDGRQLEYPRTLEESYNLSWIPSVAAIVPGPGPLRPSCRGDAENCDIVSRFRVNGGRVRTCHLAHVPEDCPHGNKLLMFDVGPRTQALGDVISVEVCIDDSSVALVASDFEGREVQRAVLEPDDDNRVTLMVFNEPDPGVPDECPLPDDIGHFPEFYRLLHPVMGIAGRLSENRPRRIGRFEKGHMGGCEEELKDYYDEYYGYDDGPRLIPHSPTECAESTIP